MQQQISLQRTLEPLYYHDDNIFSSERAQILSHQWFFVGHRSEFLKPGDFKRVKLLKTDALLVLQENGKIEAFSNRCIHRGATIVSEQSGSADSFTCPYHGWCFDQSGTLKSTRGQAKRIEGTAALPCFDVMEVAGLVLLRLKKKQNTNERTITALAPYWEFYGMASAEMLHKKTIICKANWKIVVENFLECFHCASNHPQLSEAEKHVELLESNKIHQFITLQQAYFRRAESLGHPIPSPQFIDSGVSEYAVINAVPLCDDVETGTQDGKLKAPLMGKQKTSDRGFLYGSLGPLIHFSLYSDYCVFFNFIPTSPTTSEIEVTWWVKDGARRERPVNKEAICWLWEHTIEQDAALCELVQEQVESFEARPGVYTQMEEDSASFCRWYRQQMPILTSGIVA